MVRLAGHRTRAAGSRSPGRAQRAGVIIDTALLSAGRRRSRLFRRFDSFADPGHAGLEAKEAEVPASAQDRRKCRALPPQRLRHAPAAVARRPRPGQCPTDGSAIVASTSSSMKWWCPGRTRPSARSWKQVCRRRVVSRPRHTSLTLRSPALSPAVSRSFTSRLPLGIVNEDEVLPQGRAGFSTAGRQAVGSPGPHVAQPRADRPNRRTTRSSRNLSRDCPELQEKDPAENVRSPNSVRLSRSPDGGGEGPVNFHHAGVHRSGTKETSETAIGDSGIFATPAGSAQRRDSISHPLITAAAPFRHHRREGNVEAGRRSRDGLQQFSLSIISRLRLNVRCRSPLSSRSSRSWFRAVGTNTTSRACRTNAEIGVMKAAAARGIGCVVRSPDRALIGLVCGPAFS